ncbi:50S ribosomal protein L11 methyltransferase [Octadecabacter sp. 1_MG-2023]|uniref:50S ribosomal protein L11 methyltransferase n=1 Tax=unclassified Octadecabacter TaxID=196158 RepID=UPI001C07FB97|nr:MULTISPECIES: 50S ribosomal protein L11 methyltransferase [unclassified Octadecabacter]MBU2991965.1 50S ribosomal protein L11 methyltransferase [Octadecabacter sp. B2R22]MDO6735939.1 50S ribosomal protein L11 methyltransferase [Octadecabacter sp. 1_MG-2023]
MTTFTALTTLTGKPAADALGAAMEDMDPTPTGVGVFEVEDDSGLWEVGGYFEGKPDEVALALLAATFGAKPFVVSEVPETDWVAHVKRELPPVEAGRFFVYGTHDADQLPDGRIGLLIDAAMAFGTGHHGTTLGCLKAYDRLLSDGQFFGDVADVGCGTAVLGMAAAKTGTANVIASDIDPVAVDVAVANMAANDMGDAVTCVTAAGFDDPALAKAAPFDLIFANILKGPLIMLAPDMVAHTKPKGIAILSGLLNEQAEEITAVYAQNGYNLLHHDQIGEWSTLTLGKET